MAPKFEQSIRQDWLDRLDLLVGGSGKIRIYDGTRPATVDTAITTQVVLAELACSADVIAAAVAGEPTYVDLNTITNDSSADATGRRRGLRSCRVATSVRWTWTWALPGRT